MYNEEKLYSVRSLVLIHILNFHRDLVVMCFIRMELIICSTNKVDRVKVHLHVILSSVECLAQIYFSTFSHKRHEFVEKTY